VFAISGLPNQSLTSIPYAATVRTAQQTIGATTGCAYVNTLDLPLNVDQIHLNAQGAITLGYRFAAALDNSLMLRIRNFGQRAIAVQLPQSSAYTFWANNTNVIGNTAEQDYRYQGAQTYSGSITWTGTTAPSGTTNHSYTWSRIGKRVTLSIWLNYATAGSALTQVAMALPSDVPTPAVAAGFSGASGVLFTGSGGINASVTGTAGATSAFLRRNSANTAYEYVVIGASVAAKVATITLTYDAA
jgi:hypothetical protein